MARVTLDGIRRQGGRIFVRFGKVTREFNDVQHMRECVRDVLTPEVAQAILMATVLARNPAVTTPAQHDGEWLDFDLDNATVAARGQG